MSGGRTGRGAFLVVGACALVGWIGACGLDESGLLGPDGGADVTTIDGGGDVDLDVVVTPDVTVDNYIPPPCTTLDASCIPPYDPDAGWTPVAVVTTNVTCPSGFNSIPRIFNPVAQAESCLCGCSASGTVDCSAAAPFQAFTGNGACSADAGLDAGPVPADAGCVILGGSSNDSFKGAPPKAGGNAACNGVPEGDGGWTAQSLLGCEPGQGCPDFCGLATQGWSLCVIKDATLNQQCPQGYFPLQTVSSSAVVGCSVCSCNLGNDVCDPGTLKTYTDTACSSTADTFAMNSTCHQFTQSFGSLEYTPPANHSPTCTPNGNPTGFAQLANPQQLVCCAP